MKKINNLFAIALLFFLVTNAFAQDSKSRAQTMTDRMKTDLNLTDGQVEEVLPVNQSFVESLETLRAAGGRKLAKYRKFKDADGKRDRALKQILTGEQYAKFQKQKEENREALKEAGKN